MGLPADDGVITLRPCAAGDRQRIVDERDDENARWLGPGSPEPAPTACIEVDGQVVGWIDADPAPDWLLPGEANVGYAIFPAHRGKGYAARALRLLTTELDEPGVRRAVLVIDARNAASIGAARAAGAQELPGRIMAAFPTSVVYAVELASHVERRRDRGTESDAARGRDRDGRIT